MGGACKGSLVNIYLGYLISWNTSHKDDSHPKETLGLGEFAIIKVMLCHTEIVNTQQLEAVLVLSQTELISKFFEASTPALCEIWRPFVLSSRESFMFGRLCHA